MRHHAVGQACPMDGAVVTRSHCAPCPSFVSFRISADVGTIGCNWGDDMAGWLRREMSRRDRLVPAPRAPRRRSAPSVRSAPSAPFVPRRSGTSLVAGASFGIFLAAFGVGLAMSAFEKPS